jgi:8-oxo-dGTP diphosphatase
VVTFKYSYAIPGGFINEGERVEDAAMREMKEETNVDIEPTDIFGVYSAPHRDPRGHIVTVIFIGKIISGEPRAGDDDQDIRWVNWKDLARMRISSDHVIILEDYQKWKKAKSSYWSSKVCCD